MLLHRLDRAVAVAAAVAGVAASGLGCASPPASDAVEAGAPRERVWIVDAGFATQYPAAVRAIADAGGNLRVFDFPGATLANGNRYSWARDYGPLQMPGADGSVLWDARNGGSATPALENEALPRLAARLGVRHRALDVAVQGGNWLPLADGRVIVTQRFMADNRALGTRAEIVERLRVAGVRALIEIAPLPGELTQHADMVVAVEPGGGRVLVAEVWPQAIDLIPVDAGWDGYRELVRAARESLDRTAAELRSELSDDRVFRLPQPLPHLDRHPTEDRYRPTFPSFVNGIFVTAADGATTYLYGLARGPSGSDYYAFDTVLVEQYEAAVADVARRLGVTARGVVTGDLVRNGGSLHCATVEARESPRRSAAG